MRYREGGQLAAGATSWWCRICASSSKFAHEYRGYGLKLLDLIQEGQHRPDDCRAKSFEPKKRLSADFPTPFWWIRAYIQKLHHAFVVFGESGHDAGSTQALLQAALRARNAPTEKQAPGGVASHRGRWLRGSQCRSTTSPTWRCVLGIRGLLLGCRDAGRLPPKPPRFACQPGLAPKPRGDLTPQDEEQGTAQAPGARGPSTCSTKKSAIS